MEDAWISQIWTTGRWFLWEDQKAIFRLLPHPGHGSMPYLLDFLPFQASWTVLWVVTGITFLYARVLFPPGPSFTSCWILIGLLAYLSGSADAKALFYLSGFGLLCSWYAVQTCIEGTWIRVLRFWENIWPSWCVSTLLRWGDFFVHIVPFVMVMDYYDQIAPRHLLQAILFERMYFLAVEGKVIGVGDNINAIYELRPRAPPILFFKLQIFSTIGYCFASSVCADTAAQRVLLQSFWVAAMLLIAFDHSGRSAALFANAAQAVSSKVPALSGSLLVSPFAPPNRCCCGKDQEIITPQAIMDLFRGSEWCEAPAALVDLLRRENQEFIQGTELTKPASTLEWLLLYVGSWGPPKGLVSRCVQILERLVATRVAQFRLHRTRRIKGEITYQLELAAQKVDDRLYQTRDSLKTLAAWNGQACQLKCLRKRLRRAEALVHLLSTNEAKTAGTRVRMIS